MVRLQRPERTRKTVTDTPDQKYVNQVLAEKRTSKEREREREKTQREREKERERERTQSARTTDRPVSSRSKFINDS